MNWQQQRRAILWSIGVVVTLLAPLQACADGDRRLGEPRLPTYRRQWAIIVGINYDHLSGTDSSSEVSPLENAEEDAQAIHDILRDNYGYAEDHIVLLKGEEATGEAIMNLFGDGYLGDNSRCSEEDSVLFFFAGHGSRQENANNQGHHGFLYPADVRVVTTESGTEQVDRGSCILLFDLMNRLETFCAARHKLVLLDSCHSGVVFNYRPSVRSGTPHGFSSDLFLQPTFQAMAATTAGQTASDGVDHSPFTQSLLEALECGPGSDTPRFFTASEVFTFVKNRVKDRANQDSQGRWISGEGDFCFFPKNLDQAQWDQISEEIARGREAALASLNTASPAPAPTPEENSSWLWIALVSFGGTTLIGLVGYALFRQRQLQSHLTNRDRASATTADQQAAQPKTPQKGEFIEEVTLARASVTTVINMIIEDEPCHLHCAFGVAAILGRSPQAEFTFDRSPRSVSNKHARLRYMPAQEEYVVEDLASSNGTYVDRDRIDECTSLTDGQLVQLSAAMSLTYRCDRENECPVAELHYRDANEIELARCFLVPGQALHLDQALRGLRGLDSASPEELGVILQTGWNELSWAPTSHAPPEERRKLTNGETFELAGRQVTLQIKN